MYIKLLCFTMNEDHGIKSDYYLYGIELGIIAYEEAIDWADSVIENEAQPSGEMVDLALSRPRGRNGVMDSLKEIEGERNSQLSGCMLFNILALKLEAGEELKSIASKALNVSWATQQAEDLRFEFDRIDDEISLAEQGIYGNLEQCKKDLRAALCQAPKT